MLLNRDVKKKERRKISFLCVWKISWIFYFSSWNMGPTLYMLCLYFRSVYIVYLILSLTPMKSSNATSLPYPQMNAQYTFELYYWQFKQLWLEDAGNYCQILPIVIFQRDNWHIHSQRLFYNDIPVFAVQTSCHTTLWLLFSMKRHSLQHHDCHNWYPPFNTFLSASSVCFFSICLPVKIATLS